MGYDARDDDRGGLGMSARILRSLALALGMLSLVLPARAESLKLVANYWEPFTGESVDHWGAATDLVSSALAREGYGTTIHIEPWTRALDDVYKGRFDALVAVWRTEERAAHLLLSEPYFTNHLVLVARRDRHFKFVSLDDLNGLTVGIGRGYDYSDAFKKADNFIKEPATTAEQNLKKLSSGRIDLAVEDACIARYVMRQSSQGFDLERDLEILSPPLDDIPLYFGVANTAPSAPDIVKAFNRGLASMKQDGSYDSLLARHSVTDCR